MRRTASANLLLGAVCLAVGCEGTSVKQATDSELVSLKSKCRQDGEKIRSEWKTTYYQDIFSDEPEYAYNQTLKTCLWLGEYRGPSMDKDEKTGRLIPVQTHVQFILDVYTNKTLIEYTEHDGQQIGDVSAAEFRRRKAELFKSP